MAKLPTPMAGMPDPLLSITQILDVTKNIPRHLGGQPNPDRIRKMLDNGTIKGCVRDIANARRAPFSAVVEWVQSLEREHNRKVREKVKERQS